MKNLMTRLPLSARLILIMLAISILVGIVFATAVYFQERQRLEAGSRNEIQTLSEIISANLAAPMLFDDRDAATEVLRSLAVKPEVSQVIVFDKDDQVFSTYINRQDLQFPQPAITTPEVGQTRFEQASNHLVGYSAIHFDGDTLGTIMMAVDLQLQQQRKRNYLYLVGFILFGVSILAYIVSRQLQKMVSRPIDRLNTAMQSITQSHDFSLRVDQNRQDDIGELYRGFNNMLHQLEVRDRELASHRQHLESGIANRTRELDQLVQQRIDWLENMANFLRHELKNNIAGFSTSLQLIERKTDNNDISPVVDRARRSLRYMAQLLDSVGSATSLQASLYGDRFTRIDLSTLLLERIEDLKEIYGDQFVCKVNESVFIEGNEERISQLLDKLISNAVEHNRPGFDISVELHCSGDTALLEVANHGNQLPQNRDQIFDAFVSLRDSEQDGHLGVGLFVVKLIAESHGGCVNALDLEDSDGARFIVSLPIPQG